jgi:hypothetical protein
LFKIYKVKESEVIKEAEFSQMSTIILYSLLPVRSPRPLAKKVDVYQELLKRYSTNTICEQILDQVLNDLNHTIGNRSEKHKVIERLLKARLHRRLLLNLYCDTKMIISNILVFRSRRSFTRIEYFS